MSPHTTESTMEVTTMNCFHCNQPSTMTVNIAEFNAWRDGLLIQEAFPTMSTQDRELLMTGTHPACWDAMFSDEEEDEDDE